MLCVWKYHEQRWYSVGELFSICPWYRGIYVTLTVLYVSINNTAEFVDTRRLQRTVVCRYRYTTRVLEQTYGMPVFLIAPKRS